MPRHRRMRRCRSQRLFRSEPQVSTHTLQVHTVSNKGSTRLLRLDKAYISYIVIISLTTFFPIMMVYHTPCKADEMQVQALHGTPRSADAAGWLQIVQYGEFCFNLSLLPSFSEKNQRNTLCFLLEMLRWIIFENLDPCRLLYISFRLLKLYMHEYMQYSFI